MTDCTCPECCEYRLARDEHLACSLLVDQAVAERDRAFAELRQSQRRYNAAAASRITAHSLAPIHPADDRTVVEA